MSVLSRSFLCKEMLRGGLACRTYVIGRTPLFGRFTNMMLNTNASGRVFSLACPDLSCFTGRLDSCMSRVFFVYLLALGLRVLLSLRM